METIFSFFLRSMLVSAALYAYYALFLKDRKVNQLNRIYLLAIFPLSLVMPLLSLSWLQWRLPEEVFNPLMSAAKNEQTMAKTFYVLVLCYIAVSGILLSMIGWKIYLLFRLKRRSDQRLTDGFCLVETNDPRTPFSFFNNLFWKQGEDPGTMDNAKILDHEIVHIRQYHSYDRLFSQVCCGICWINPFFWRIQRELATIHEFLADEGSFEQGDTRTFAKMILRAYQRGHFFSPDLGFTKSDIERRIGMVGRLPEKHSFRQKALMTTSLAIFLVVTLAAISCNRTFPLSPDQPNNSKHPGSDDERKEREQKLKDERNHRLDPARF